MKPRLQFILTLIAITIATHAPAAETYGIRVTGTGQVEAFPDTIRMTGTVSSEAKLALDAISKFHNNKRRVLTALEGLGLEGLTIDNAGVALNAGGAGSPQAQMAILTGQQPPEAEGKVSVSEELTIKLTNISKMKEKEILETIVKVIDAGKDAGMSIASKAKGILEMQMQGAEPTALAVYTISDPAKLRQEAYAKAMANARANAERLAKLAGVKIGAVISISEAVAVSTEEDEPNNVYAVMFGMSMNQANQDLISKTYKKLPVTVNLNVQFTIAR